ncbi:MAG: isoprenylcysteine carboxylmethyltransferase family protein [Candidatus Acidiferrum sp.]
MSDRARFFARWRVRLGYPLAVAVLWLAKPTPESIASGAVLGALGLGLRAYAAGYLHKQETLTITGPYAYTRNPLYFGSAILALGAGVATHSLIAGALLIAYFAVFYSIVMKREEGELCGRHGEAFEAYARAVPLFFPRVTAAKMSGVSAGSPGAFSYAQYRKNHEWQATLGFVLLLAALLVLWRLRCGGVL